MSQEAGNKVGTRTFTWTIIIVSLCRRLFNLLFIIPFLFLAVLFFDVQMEISFIIPAKIGDELETVWL